MTKNGRELQEIRIALSVSSHRHLQSKEETNKDSGVVTHSDDAMKLCTGTANVLKSQFGGDLTHPNEPSKGLGLENVL